MVLTYKLYDSEVCVCVYVLCVCVCRESNGNFHLTGKMRERARELIRTNETVWKGDRMCLFCMRLCKANSRRANTDDDGGRALARSTVRVCVCMWLFSLFNVVMDIIALC